MQQGPGELTTRRKDQVHFVLPHGRIVKDYQMEEKPDGRTAEWKEFQMERLPDEGTARWNYQMEGLSDGNTT